MANGMANGIANGMEWRENFSETALLYMHARGKLHARAIKDLALNILRNWYFLTQSTLLRFSNSFYHFGGLYHLFYISYSPITAYAVSHFFSHFMLFLDRPANLCDGVELKKTPSYCMFRDNCSSFCYERSWYGHLWVCCSLI